jgi:hypothetical protein
MGDDSLLGVAEKNVIDLPLSAKKTCQNVPPKNEPYAPPSRATEVP